MVVGSGCSKLSTTPCSLQEKALDLWLSIWDTLLFSSHIYTLALLTSRGPCRNTT